MADFDFKVGFDASEVISGTQKTEQSLGGLEGAATRVRDEFGRFVKAGGDSIGHVGDGATEAGQKIVDGLGGGLNQVAHKFDETKGHSEGFLGSLKEKFGEIGGLLAGGAIFGAGAFGIEKLFEAGEKHLKSLEDYQIALRQSGVESTKLGAAEKAGGAIIDSLSEKYAKNKDELRGVLTEVTGLGGISGEQSKKVAEIGLAFEQVGVPARSFKQLLAGAGGPESLAALESIKVKFPAIAIAMEGAGTAGQKIDAVFKGITPTLEGMKEAADGPLGSLERIKNAGSELTGALGSTIIEAIQPLTGAFLAAANVLKDDVIPAISSVGHFLSDHKAVLEIAVGGYIALRSAMAIKEAGGLVSSLGKISSSAIDAGKSIVDKLLPGVFAKTAADGAAAAAKTTETAAEVGNTIATEANVVAKEAGAVAEEGMAVASEGLGAAMTVALGPIGLAIAAVAAIGIGIALFVGHTKELGAAAKDADDALNEFNKLAGDQVDVDKKANALDILSARYDELSANGNRNAKQQKELEDVTRELSAAVPEATDKFDAFSGEVTIATEKVRALNIEQQKVAEANKQEALQNLKDKAKDLANSFTEAQKSIAKLRGEQALLDSNINVVPHGLLDGLGMAFGLGKSIKDKQAENTAEIVKQTAELNKHRPELAKLVEVETAQGITVEQISKEYGFTVDQVKSLVASNKAAEAAAEEHRKTAAGLADEYNKAHDGLQKIVTENLQASGQQQRDLLVLQNALKDAESQHDNERVASLQAQIKSQKELIAANLNIAQLNQADFDLREKAQAQQKEKLEGDRHAVELADVLQKKEEASIETILRKNNVHKLSEIGEAILTVEKLKGLEAEERAVEAIRKYADTQLQQRQNAEKITEIELQKEQLLEKQNDELKKLADEYIKIQETNINGETALLQALSSFGGKNIDAQLRLFSLTSDGVSVKIGILREQLVQHKEFDVFNQEIGTMVDSTGKLVSGVDLAKTSFELLTKATEHNSEARKFNADLLQQVKDGLISESDAAKNAKPFIEIDPIISAFTQLQKIELDKIKFFQDQLKKENDLATLRLQINQRLFGFDENFIQKELDLLKHNYDEELRIIDTSNLSKEAKELLRLQSQKKFYDESDKLTEENIKRQQQNRDAFIEAFVDLDSTRSQLQEKILLIASAFEAEQLNRDEAHKKGLLSDAAYYAQTIAAEKKAAKGIKDVNAEMAKDAKETVGAGFSAAFGLLNKSFFDPLDKSLHASTNIFGAFASGAIHHLVDIGEQALANLAEGLVASAIATATTTAAMATIEAAAAPAAFAVAVASFGVAAGTALGALAGSYTAFQGLLQIPKLELGTVVSSPTLALIGEKFEDELVLPMKTAKEFLDEASGGSGNKAVTRDDIFQAMDSALKANPIRGKVSGYDINLVNNAQNQRITRRGGPKFIITFTSSTGAH